MKNSDKKPKQISDKNIHRSFQLGALLLVVYIVYSIYSGGQQSSSIISRSDARGMSDQEIDEKVAASIKKITEQPEYKNIKVFADYVESNVNKTDVKLLKAEGGVLIFVPDSQIKDNNEIKIDNKEINFIINTKKLSETVTEPLENDSSTVTPNDKSTEKPQ